MNFEQASQLAQHYRLGRPVGTLTAVSGGMIHQIWRLETTQGDYAIKELNPTIMARPGVPQMYRNSELIARTASEQGIPAVPALVFEDDNPLLKLDDLDLMVYEWAEGQVLSNAAAQPQQARQMGTLLARIHGLKIEPTNLNPPYLDAIPASHWQELAEQARVEEAEWATRFRAMQSSLVKWSAAYADAGQTLRQTTVVSHCDLDQKNVLWRDPTSPQIIDWEAAGLNNPSLDLIGLALDWSGFRTGTPNQAVLEATLQGYRQIKPGLKLEVKAGLWGVAGIMLNWLEFNVERSLGRANEDRAERELAQSQVELALSQLQNFTAHLDQWAGWFDQPINQ